jgi:leader peptidase (prepilin peptidase)/N-methyltransferase
MTSTLFPGWTSAFGFILGAVIGSFLNMAISRTARNLSRRRPVATRNIWVPLLTGILYALIWWRYLAESYEPVRMAVYMFAAALFVVIIVIDIRYYIIPDGINALLLLAGVGYHASQGHLMTAVYGAVLGWSIIFGIALLGRIGFGKDAMGDGDIKMMRGVGALLGTWLVLGTMAMAVVLGLIGGILGILLARKQAVATEAPAERMQTGEEDSTPAATPIPLVLLAGVWYLSCLDVVSQVVPRLNRVMSRYFPEEDVSAEEDDWQPGATTIPFGPYLAAGALACMIFAGPIENGLKSYFHAGGQLPATEVR